MTPPLSRRTFLAFAGGAGAVFGFARLGLAQMAPGVANAVPPEVDPGLWFAIDREGIVTIHIAKAEMGQQIGVALGRMLAEELGADWERVRLHYVGSGARWGTLWTAYSTSVADGWLPLRRAGAAGRRVLAERAAPLLGVRAGHVTIRGGQALGGGRRVGFADIVRHGFAMRRFAPEELAALPLRPPGSWRLIGRDAPAPATPAIVSGAQRFASDARVPGMLHACPKLPPTRFGSTVMSVDDHLAQSVPGYVGTQVVRDPSGTVDGWPVVVARSWMAVLEALPLVRVDWKAGPGMVIGEKEILARARALLRGTGGAALVARRSDWQGAAEPDGGAVTESGAVQRLARVYTTAAVAHFEMEPLAALVLERDGGFVVHAGVQGRSLLLPVLARALGVAADAIEIESYPLGGNLGRRLNGDWVVLAALTAQAMKQPVKLQLLPRDAGRMGAPRMPTVQRVAAELRGADVAMTEQRVVSGWPNRRVAPALLRKSPDGALFDPFAVLGAAHLYRVGERRIRAIRNDAMKDGVRAGYFRGGGAGWTVWALESFMDEMAAALGEDPVALRLRLLDGKDGARLAAVIRDCAGRAGWDAARAPGAGVGLAASVWQASAAPTYVACAAEVHVDDGEILVDRLTLATDAGVIVAPRSAAAQTEGAALLGLSMALHEGTEFLNGRIAAGSLVRYQPLRMAGVPAIDSRFLPGAAPPGGVGEAMVGVVAPAIGNAIFRATGARLRHLPMGRQALAEARAAGKKAPGA